MELHQLRYAVAVARLASFSRAAEQCHVSQPSLSQQIRKLEEELGQPMFVRLRRGTKPTEFGSAFVERAVRILSEVDAAGREARQARELVSGQVVVGVLPTIAPYLLPAVLDRYGRRFPGVSVVVQEDTTAQLLRLVAAAEVDFAVLSPPVNDGRFEVRELFREELVLVVPEGHRLAGRRSVGTKDLEAERFILMREGHCLADQVTRFCDRGDVRPQIVCRSAQIETVLALVRSGLGISLVPRMAEASRANESDRLVFRSLTGGRPGRSIGVAVLRGREPGPAAREFMKDLEACGRDVSARASGNRGR